MVRFRRLGGFVMLQGRTTVPASVQQGVFNVVVGFNARIVGFKESDISLYDLTGNGAQGVVHEICGSGTDYNVCFSLPVGVSGSFEIVVEGYLRTENGYESVRVPPAVVRYNTVETVHVGFGNVVRRRG